MKKFRAFSMTLMLGVWLMMLAGPMAGRSAAQASSTQMKETPEGVVLGNDDTHHNISAVISGATLLRSYEPYQPKPDQPGQVRELNRAVVNRFFELPIGEQRARLYADDGVKQILNLGVQWRGLAAQLKNNEQNKVLFSGWKWKEVVIWDTQDPTVFMVEAHGSQTEGGAGPADSHYVMQFVVVSGKIELMREMNAPLVLAP